jgi:malonyl CoA-acyl carrier protein transacylase
MLVAGVACWRAWREKGGALPAWFAGHSLGEYTALVAANALRFEDALPLVRVARPGDAGSGARRHRRHRRDPGLDEAALGRSARSRAR